MQPRGGTAYVKVDGTQYDLHGSLTVFIGGVEREEVVGMDGHVGFNEKPVAPFVDADLSDSGGLSLEALGAIKGATLTIELVNGKVYSFQETWVTKVPELNAGDGRMSVRFQAVRAQEII